MENFRDYAIFYISSAPRYWIYIFKSKGIKNMYLKYSKSLQDSTLTITLYTSGFTTDETRAIRQLGSPAVELTKEYEVSTVSVDINAPVSTLNLTQVFQGSVDNIDDVLAEGSEFITDIAQAITEKMVALMTQYRAIQTATSTMTGQIKINDEVNNSQE